MWITLKSFDSIHLSLDAVSDSSSLGRKLVPRGVLCCVFDWCVGVSAVWSSVVLDLRLIGFETAQGSAGSCWLGYPVAASHAFELAFAHHFHGHPYFSIIGSLRRAVGGRKRKTMIWLFKNVTMTEKQWLFDESKKRENHCAQPFFFFLGCVDQWKLQYFQMKNERSALLCLLNELLVFYYATKHIRIKINQMFWQSLILIYMCFVA